MLRVEECPGSGTKRDMSSPTEMTKSRAGIENSGAGDDSLTVPSIQSSHRSSLFRICADQSPSAFAGERFLRRACTSAYLCTANKCNILIDYQARRFDVTTQRG